MIVVKLGGSLLHSDQLRDWLQRLKQFSEQEAVLIVPGGGVFADQVRNTQTQLGFSDVTADKMALLAMAQYGLLLSDLVSGLSPWSPSAQLGAFSVWTPEVSERSHISLPANWDTTSDSLALWMAQQLDARECVLIKTVTLSHQQLTAWQQADIIDANFAALLASKAVPCRVINVNDNSPLSEAGIQLQ
jgi:aspartokinase-like uncharacterized kinase